MRTPDFSKIAARYEKDSLVQKSASEALFDLVAIRDGEDVLDLGCGTGNLTRQIRGLTRGKVVGIDSAEGMIDEARRNYGPLGITFTVCRAEESNFAEMFDVIFCNSTFQWLNPPEPILRQLHRALRMNGRMGIQAPARKAYSPNFLKAVEAVRRDPRTRETFARFRAPWLFFDTEEEYRSLFETVGFDVLRSSIEEITTVHTSDEVFKVFDSGAAAGYLSADYYDVPITDGYIEDFRGIVRDAFAQQTNRDGKVNLTFFRVYLLAQKVSGQPSAMG